MKATDGFVMVPNWLIDESDLTLHELAVYVVLLRFRDHRTGECFPSLSTIAERARISRETVKRTIPALEKKGMIQVERRKQGTKNLPNVYKVAVPKTKISRPAFPTVTSEGGVSQTLPPVDNSKSRVTQTLGRVSQPLGVGSDSASNKIQLTRSNEQDLTPVFTEDTSPEIKFEFTEEQKATEPQVAYLKDLATIVMYQAGYNPEIDDTHLNRWRKLTTTEATKQIKAYLKDLGRPEEEWYPEPGTPAYEQLSEAGKVFADTGGMPDSVFEYGFKLKENTA